MEEHYNIGMTPRQRARHRPGRGIDPTKPYLNLTRTLAHVYGYAQRPPRGSFAGQEVGPLYCLHLGSQYLNRFTSNITDDVHKRWTGSKEEAEVLRERWNHLSIERIN